MYSKMIPLYNNDEVGNYVCGWCGQIFIEMLQLKEHIKSSTEDLLVENAFNCHIGFIRIAEEVKELIRPDDDYSNKLTTEVLKRTLSIFHHCAKIVGNEIEPIDRENVLTFEDTTIKLNCHKCSKVLENEFDAWFHQENEHELEDFLDGKKKEMIVYDRTNYGDEIELQDIGIYMVESFEYNSAKLKVYAKFGKYTFQNRNYFKKFLNDGKIKSNFVVDIFHHSQKVVGDELEPIDRDEIETKSESIIKLYCHQCSKALKSTFEAYNHQKNEHNMEPNEKMKEVVVYDRTNYGDEIELVIVGTSEYNPAKVKVYAQLGKFTIQNRKHFKKFLNDEKIRSNFVVDVKLKV